jgi:hypothetical protein
LPKFPFYNHFSRTTSKTPFFYCCVLFRFRGNVFTEPLVRNGHLFFLLLHKNGCTLCLFRGLCLTTVCTPQYLTIFLEGLKKTTKISIRMTGDPVEIRTEYLPNTSLKRSISYHSCFVFVCLRFCFRFVSPPCLKIYFRGFLSYSM